MQAECTWNALLENDRGAAKSKVKLETTSIAAKAKGLKTLVTLVFKVIRSGLSKRYNFFSESDEQNPINISANERS